MKNIEIPSSVNKIEYQIFRDCSSLESIKIPSSVTSIEKNAFYNCSNLKSIEIPSSVTSIGSGAFEGCDKLVICSRKDAYAHTYAIENNIPWKDINDIVKEFSIDESKNCSITDKNVVINGKLTLEDNVKTSSSILSSEVSAIQWKSSDQDIIANSDISCIGVNSYDNRSAQLMISFTPKKSGKVTLTGTTKNGLTASCDVIIGNCIVIEEKANDMEGCTIAISGEVILEASVEATEKNLQNAIDSLKFESSDNSKAKVLSCNAVKSEDHRSAKLEIWTTLYNEGEAKITVTAQDGHKAECIITIQENVSEETYNYEGDYEKEIREFMTNKGTYNTLKYLCNSGNFTASTYVAEHDAKFGNLLSMVLTDMYYRGWEGRKDLLDGSTSVKEAEKILASLLSAYQGEIESLAQVKTAHKYANMVNDAFDDYSKTTNMFEGMKSEEIQVVKKYFSEDNLTKLLYDGEYSKIKAPVNQILQSEGMNQIMNKSEVFQTGTEASKKWNKMMDGFTESAEMSNIVKKGCKNKLGGIEVGGGLKDLGYTLELVSLSQDTINYLYRLESLLTANEMYCEMLLYLQKECPYSVVQEAAGNLYKVINCGVEGVLNDVKTKAVNKVTEIALDKTLNVACECSVPSAMFKKSFDWGVILSNVLFKVGTTQELKDSLRIQAYLSNTLGRWALSKEREYMASIDTEDEALKAKELYYSLYMVWESRKCAEETLQSLLRTTGGQWSANYSASVGILNTLKSFEENIFEKGRMENLFGISVSCPVDVEIRNAEGEKLLTLKDGTECNGYTEGIYYYCVYNPLSKDYDKYIYYSEDSDYKVTIVGNDLGSVDASVISINDKGYLDEFYFENREIEKGTVIQFDNISKEEVEYKEVSSDGSEKSGTMDKRKAEKVATESILLNEDLVELQVGEKKLLKFSFEPANATNQKVNWSSSDESIVSVNSDGVITAISAGTAEITVSQGDLKTVCRITVIVLEEPTIQGDVNGDGEINIKDSALIKRYLAGADVELDLKAADVNGDGEVNIKDSALIKRKLAGWE